MTKRKEFFRSMGGNGWKPNKFVQDVEIAYRNNGFCDAFVESSGRKGEGKTAFTLISGYQVYGSYLKSLEQLYFAPKSALVVFRGLMKEAKNTGNPVKRIPFITIDDATMSLNKSRWWLPGIQDFAEFYSIVRSCCSGVVFTGPSLRLPESIACDIKYKIIIKPLASAKKIETIVEGNYPNTGFWRNNVEQARKLGIKKPYLWRQAKLYTNFTIPSSTKRFISPHIHTAYFPLHYPNDIYKIYDVRRNEKVAEMIDRAVDGEKVKKIGRPPNSDLLHKVVRDRYYDLKKKGYNRDKSASIIGMSTESLKIHVTAANNIEKGE